MYEKLRDFYGIEDEAEIDGFFFDKNELKTEYGNPNIFGTKIIILALSIFASSILTIYIDSHKEVFKKVMNEPNNILIRRLFNSDTISDISCKFLAVGIAFSLFLFIIGLDALLRLEAYRFIYLWFFGSLCIPATLLSGYSYLFHDLFPNTPNAISLVFLFIIILISNICALWSIWGLFKCLFDKFCEIVADSKDRLTIVIATLGLIISLIAAFKK